MKIVPSDAKDLQIEGELRFKLSYQCHALVPHLI